MGFWISVILNVVLLLILIFGWFLLVDYAKQIVKLKKEKRRLRQQLKEKNEKVEWYEEYLQQDQKDWHALQADLRVIRPKSRRRRQ